jgi:hypothetical protein
MGIIEKKTAVKSRQVHRNVFLLTDHPAWSIASIPFLTANDLGLSPPRPSGPSGIVSDIQVLTKLDDTYGTFSHCRAKSRADSASKKETSDTRAILSGLIDRPTFKSTITFSHGRHNIY